MIPYATTTITVLRRPDPDDAYESDRETAYEPVASGVRAHLDAGSGGQVEAGGLRTDQLVRFMCDLTDLTALDMIEDEATRLRWQVSNINQRPQAMGMLDHLSGLAQRVTGVAG